MCIYSSPIGPLKVEINGGKLVSVQFIEGSFDGEFGAPPASIIKSFDTYFHERQNLDLEVQLEGTEFQKQVWKEVMKLPFGSTCSYLELAELCGGKTYTRAVAAANGANPLLVVVPCHRVIGSNNSLTGYAGGLPRKEWLLDWEKGQGNLFE